MKDRKLLNIELGRLSPEEYQKRQTSGLVVVLDNIRSSHNVGAAFRSSDAFGVDKIYICGISSTPPSPEIHKSALGAEDVVPWVHVESTLDAVSALKAEGYTVISVEQTLSSVKLDAFVPYEKGCAPRKYALIFGNEVSGVAQEVVDASDVSLEIPQWGTKHSLNVSVSIGVVLWHFRLFLSSL